MISTVTETNKVHKLCSMYCTCCLLWEMVCKAQTSLGLKREAFGNFRRPKYLSCRLHSLPIFKNTFEKNTSKSQIPIRNLQ